MITVQSRNSRKPLFTYDFVNISLNSNINDNNNTNNQNFGVHNHSNGILNNQNTVIDVDLSNELINSRLKAIHQSSNSQENANEIRSQSKSLQSTVCHIFRSHRLFDQFDLSCQLHLINSDDCK